MEMYLFAHSGNYDTDLQTDRPGHREFTLPTIIMRKMIIILKGVMELVGYRDTLGFLLSKYKG